MMSLAQMLRRNLVAGMFLDRDGVVNVKAAPGKYITSPDDLVLLPGAAAAIRHVNALWVPVYIVTNQRWVAGRRDGPEALAAIHRRLHALLGSASAHVDGIYSCVHEINRCRCRKPARGLVDQVLNHNRHLALSSCVMVGDADTDVELAERCGMYSVRVCGGGDAHRAEREVRAAETATDLHAAVLGARVVRTRAVAGARNLHDTLGRSGTTEEG